MSASVKVKVLLLEHGAGLYEATGNLPAYESKGAAGADLRAAVTSPIEIAPGGRALIPTALKVQIPAGYEMQVRPRSGLALKSGITVLNAPGTIDSDYRGEVGVILINHSNAPYVVARGERIAQGVIQEVIQCEFEAAASEDDLSSTDRGIGGFGSTGRA